MKTVKSWIFSGRRNIGALAISLTAGVALVWAAPAPAAPHYAYNVAFEESFKSAMSASNNKAFSVLGGVAVDNSPSANKGDIYVVDSGTAAPHGVVDKFEVKGSTVKFLCELGGSNMESPGTRSKPCALGKQAPEAFTTLDDIAVGPGGEVYVVNVAAKVVDKFNVNGEYESQLKETESGKPINKPVSVATGPGGEVYVGDNGPPAIIDKFTKTGGFQYSIVCGTKKEVVGSTIESICGSATSWKVNDIKGLTVGGNGDVYVVDTGAPEIFRFSVLGAYEKSIPDASETNSGIAAGQQESSLFIDHGAFELGSIEWYNAAGVLEETFKITEPARPRTLNGISAGPGMLYVSDNVTGLNFVELWELIEPPTETGCTASNITASGANLTGEVNPNGKETKYKFEYGPEPSFGHATGEAGAGNGTSFQQVAATVHGLTPETKYDCRISAESSGGKAEFVTGKFTTRPAVEGVRTNPAQNVTFESAKLNASLIPEGLPVEYFIEYGTSTAYGHSTAVKTSSSGTEVAVSEVLSGLVPMTTYHYRIVTKRTIEGTPYELDGQDETFTTGGISPEIQSESASAVGPFSATLEATINPGNSATSYYFMYGTSPESEQAFMPAAVASGYGSVQVNPRVLQALQPDTTYYYHVVAENAFGKIETIEGPHGPEEKTFTTLPASAPEVSLGPVSAVGSTSANMAATVNANGLATEYEIELGLSGTYTPVAVQSAGDEATPQTASYGLSGLAPGTTYELRIIAWNEAGEATSSVQSFTTASSATPAFVQPVTPALLATPTLVEAKEPVLEKTTTKKALTRAQKLAKALKACKQKAKSKRAGCEKQARKQYAPAKTKKKR